MGFFGKGSIWDIFRDMFSKEKCRVHHEIRTARILEKVRSTLESQRIRFFPAKCSGAFKFSAEEFNQIRYMVWRLVAKCAVK